MKQHRLKIIVLLLLMGAAFGLVCTGSTPGTDKPATHTLDAENVHPRLVPRDCWFKIPAGANVSCGYVGVPEDRSQPSTAENTIQLAVAVFHSTASQPEPDPVFLLAGGPGQGAIEAVVQYFDAFTRLLKVRDLVAFDQRGTGYSLPSLNCVEDNPRACHDRLTRAGIRLAAYTTRENAADVDDLRRALGRTRINLLGGSYGTRLGLTVMQHYSSAVRSAILDSVAPPQLDLGPELVRSKARGLRVLFAGCSAHSECRASYPELETTLYDLVRQLDRQPLFFEVDGTPIILSGRDFIRLIFLSMYSAEALPHLPKLVYDTREGDFKTLHGFIRRVLLRPDYISEGMMFSVECAEDVAFETPAEFAAAASELAAPIREHIATDDLYFYGICEFWGVPPAPARVKSPVASDIPALLLAGKYDPLTPVGWAELAAETLPRSYIYEIPDAAHAVFITSECAQSLMAQFLDDPMVAPDAACIDMLGSPDFIVEP